MLDKIQIVKPAEIEKKYGNHHKRIKRKNLARAGVLYRKKMYPHFCRF